MKFLFFSILWPFAVLALLTFGHGAYAAETDYELVRIVEWDCEENIEVVDLRGRAEVIDQGPYTPVDHIKVEVNSCNSLFGSPPPECDPVLVYIDERTDGYLDDGGTYILEDGTFLTIIRRGSIETGDASLILFIGGRVLVFKQV